MTTVLRNICGTLIALFAMTLMAALLLSGLFSRFVVVTMIVMVAGGLITGAVEIRQLGPRPRDERTPDERGAAATTRFVVVTAWVAFAYVLPVEMALPILLGATLAGAVFCFVLHVALAYGVDEPRMQRRTS